jgi:peptide/nickel transport system substrate-binding protein
MHRHTRSVRTTSRGGRLLAGSLVVAMGGVLSLPVGFAASAASTRPAASASELIVGISGPLAKLTPVGLEQTDMTYDRLIYEPLVLDGAKGSVLPNLASSWSVSSNGKTVTLHLRSGVTFTNGKPFDASAVVAELKWAQNPKNPNSQDSKLTLQGDTFSTSGSSTVQITTPITEANSLLNSLVTLPMVDLSSNLVSDPIGTGPYVVSSFQPNVQLTATAYSHYWNKANMPKIKTVKLVVFESAAAETAALEAHAIDVLTYPPLNQVAGLKSSGFDVVSSPGTGNYVLWGSVKAKDSPFDNQDFREALSWAFNRPLFSKLDTAGIAVPTCDMWASTSPTFVQNLPDCGYSLSKAKAFLQASGYRNASLTIYTMDTKWPEVNDFLPIYQADLKSIGVRLNIVDESPSLYGSTETNIIDHDAPGLALEFFGWGNVDQYFVADYPFYGYSFNLSSYYAPQYVNMVKQAVSDTNPTTAAAQYKALAVYVAKAAFCIDLATRPYVYVYNSQFKGVTVDYDGIANWAAVS